MLELHSLLTRHVRQARENEARLEKACLASVGTDFDLQKTCQNKTNQPTKQTNRTERWHVLIISVLGETKMSEFLKLIGPASLAYLEVPDPVLNKGEQQLRSDVSGSTIHVLMHTNQCLIRRTPKKTYKTHEQRRKCG